MTDVLSEQKTTHTPGPWNHELGASIHEGWWVITAASMSNPASPLARIAAWDEPTAEADARLIAAAPEMLEALKAGRKTMHAVWGALLIDQASYKYLLGQLRDGIANFDAAIAAAEGRQS